MGAMMSAYVHRLPVGAEHWGARGQRGRLGRNWLALVLVSEALFVFCRALVHDSVNLDDPMLWLLGLAPFVLAFYGPRAHALEPLNLIKTWILTLIVFLTFHLLSVSQFIEHPIFLRIDQGFIRYFVCSAAYTLIGAAAAVALSRRGSGNLMLRAVQFSVTVPAMSLVMALALFMPL